MHHERVLQADGECAVDGSILNLFEKGSPVVYQINETELAGRVWLKSEHEALLV